jgi:pimeloyl-ACP methyl ester carboxylesterase
VKHVDTVSAARDIEAIRLALGDGKLNYLGLSYGTQLGSTYADLYPHHIRTMALDAALVHSLPVPTMLTDEAGTYQQSLDRFFRWCRGSTTCALHGRNVRRLYLQLVRRADRSPIPAPGCHHAGCRPYVNGEDIRFDTQGLLLFKKPIPLVAPQGWNDLAIAIRQARRGDASKLSAPLAASPTDDALNGSAIANECLDWPTPVHDRRDLTKLQRLAEDVAPTLRGASQSWTIIAGCVGWPWPAVNPPHRTHVVWTPPVLVVNATHDPSTSYSWAQQLSHEIRSSVLLTRAGDGHTSYLAHGRSKTRDAIDRYLITGKTPPAHTVYPN